MQQSCSTPAPTELFANVNIVPLANSFFYLLLFCRICVSNEQRRALYAYMLHALSNCQHNIFETEHLTNDWNCRKFSSNIEIDLANGLNSWIIQHNANGISLQNAIFKRTICNAVFSRARRFYLSQQIFSALSYTISMATGNQTLIIYNSCLSLLFLTKSLANIQLWFGLVYKIN